jgi:hypothetical protein
MNPSITATEAALELKRRRAARDPVYFIEQYVKTFDPRPEAYPHVLDFKLYDFQKDLALQFVKDIEDSTNDFVEKSRDMGVSWLIVAVLVWFWLYKPGFQALIGTYIEDLVDNGELDSLFGKIEFIIQNIKDPAILPSGFDMDKHRTYMSLNNPVNGNAILGKAPTKKFGRSGRYTVVLFDELGFWQWGRQAWTAASDSARCRIAITTPPDEPSFAKKLREGGKIKVTTIHWMLHPLKNQVWYEEEKNHRTQEEMLHELDISWEYSNTGRPYPEASDIRVGSYPYNEEAPLYVSIDLGLDAVALGFYQPIPNTNWIVLVDAYEMSNRIIDWFIPFFGGEFDSAFTYTDTDLAFIKLVRPWFTPPKDPLDRWTKPIFYGDPSGNSKHVESGISPYTILYKKQGIRVQVNEIENDWVSRRDATKKLITHLAVNDTERTRWWLECLKNAHYPKREETSQATTGITKPVHDWTSHHRTQTEFFAVNYKRTSEPTQSELKRIAANELAYMDDHGRMMGAGLDINKILHDANRKRRR